MPVTNYQTNGTGQENAVGPVAKAPTAQASYEESLDGGRADYRLDAEPSSGSISGSPTAHDAKVYPTLAAKLALLGWELRTIHKDQGQHFEVRRHDQAFMVGTRHDVAGIATSMQSARLVEVE